jgi:hypothetical protein
MRAADSSGESSVPSMGTLLVSDRKNGFVSLRDADDLGNADLLPMAGRSEPDGQRPHRKVIVVQEALQADILWGIGREQIADVFLGDGSGAFEVLNWTPFAGPRVVGFKGPYSNYDCDWVREGWTNFEALGAMA